MTPSLRADPVNIRDSFTMAKVYRLRMRMWMFQALMDLAIDALVEEAVALGAAEYVEAGQ